MGKAVPDVQPDRDGKSGRCGPDFGYGFLEKPGSVLIASAESSFARKAGKKLGEQISVAGLDVHPVKSGKRGHPGRFDKRFAEGGKLVVGRH